MSYTYRLPKTQWFQEPSFQYGINRISKLATDKVRLKTETCLLSDRVKWPHPEASTYSKSLEKVDNLSKWTIPKLKDATLYLHIWRLKEYLLWWETLPTPTKLTTGYRVMYQCLTRGPKFADELDDYLKYGTRLWSSLELTYGKDDYPSYCNEVEDWDQLPSPYHLIPWERPPSDDINLVFQNTEVPNDKLESLREKIREKIHPPYTNKRTLDDVDLLKLTGASTSFDPSKNKRVSKTGSRLSQMQEIRTTRQFIYDYVHVDKAPHESRECVVPTPETLATTMLLEAQMEQVISCPYDVIREKDFSYLPNYLSVYSHCLYILSDQKKCGLTFPRILLVTLYEELQKAFPDWDFNLGQGLSESYIKYNNQMIKMRGGPGLGQFNKSISLLVGLLFEIWKEEQDPELHLDGHFYNDDQVIRLHSSTPRVEPLPLWVNELALSWDMHMESFGLHVHHKKPFISDGGVFLEVYGHGFRTSTKKIGQKVGNLFDCLVSPNIAAAKEHFANVYDTLDKDNQEIAYNLLFDRILPIWGYEFYPQEAYLPFQFGGWIRSRTEKGLDNLFNCVDKVPIHMRKLLNLPFLKKKVKAEAKSRDFKSQISKINKTLPKKLINIPEQWDYYSMVRSSLKSFRSSYNEQLSMWKTFLKDRQRLWEHSHPMPYREFFNNYWRLTFEEGKAFAPPYFAYQEEGLILPIGEPIEIGKRQFQPGDPLRCFLKLQQMEERISPYLRLYSHTDIKGKNHALYHFVNSLKIQEIAICPFTISLIMIMGEDNLINLLDYTRQMGGIAKFPPLKVDILNEIGVSTSDQFTKLLVIDHDCETAWFAESQVDFDLEIDRLKSQFIQSIYSELNDPEFQDLSLNIQSYEDFQNLLKESIPRLNPVIEQNQPIDLPEDIDLQENKNTLEYILHQIYAPDHFLAQEDAIRHGLAAQILGSNPSDPDIFDDDDVGLDMFGE
jgi:hypothetical protein